MNKQGPDKIDWTDMTLNPVVGCTRNCSYCYARKQAKRQKHNCKLCYEFIPHHHLDRLEKLNSNQKPKKIFIDSMWDWNCRHNETWWMHNILVKMAECPQHTFQVLSKDPAGYERYPFPENVWLGTTIDGTMRTERNCDLLVDGDRARIKFVSFEPLLAHIDPYLIGIDWVIIGADSTRGARNPPDEWADIIIVRAREQGVAVWVKDNYKYHTRIKEFPLKGEP